MTFPATRASLVECPAAPCGVRVMHARGSHHTSSDPRPRIGAAPLDPARDRMSDSPKPLSDTLEHPLQSRLLGAAATSTAALIDRAQLAERQGRTQEARALYEQALSQL